jgi:hypothetical protein
MDQQSTFLIIREDLQVDPVTLVAEGILIGRLPTSELLLNHPSVSRLHAGITNVEGDFYIRNLRPSNPILLNGKRLEQYEALASGDVLGVGPFSLNIEVEPGTLVIKVSLQIGATAEDARQDFSGAGDLAAVDLAATILPGGLLDLGVPKKHPAPKAKPAGAPASKALDIFWDKRITAATKMVKPSPLFPLGGRPSGKAQSVWTPTTDLKRRWPLAIVLWSVVVTILLAAGSAWFYASALSPAPISEAHTRAKPSLSPAVAKQANAGSCTSCHALRASMESQCSSCHTTDAFVATVIKPHIDAGIGCVACHDEHRGADFNPMESALRSCAGCHNDANKSLYNGKSVGTPHGGTLGYPVINGTWVWKGLDEDELAQRRMALNLQRPPTDTEKLMALNLQRLPTDTEDLWRRKQFHLIHLYRVKVLGGLIGNKQGELTCSSCHATISPIDLATPRTTCAKCHNGQFDPRANRQVIAADQPNCTSCHIQHLRDKRHWNPGLLAGLDKHFGVR